MSRLLHHCLTLIGQYLACKISAQCLILNQYVTRSHKMVLKSILGATEILIYSEKGENADYYGEKIIVVSVKIKKLWQVKVSGSESSHFEKKHYKAVQHILGIFP